MLHQACLLINLWALESTLNIFSICFLIGTWSKVKERAPYFRWMLKISSWQLGPDLPPQEVAVLLPSQLHWYGIEIQCTPSIKVILFLMRSFFSIRLYPCLRHCSFDIHCFFFQILNYWWCYGWCFGTMPRKHVTLHGWNHAYFSQISVSDNFLRSQWYLDTPLLS